MSQWRDSFLLDPESFSMHTLGSHEQPVSILHKASSPCIDREILLPIDYAGHMFSERES